MRKTSCVVLAAALSACGSNGGDSTAAATSTAAANEMTSSSATSTSCRDIATDSALAVEGAPDWLLCLGLDIGADTRAEQLDGVTYYVSDDEGEVYVEGCAWAESSGLTDEGGRYGPDADRTHAAAYTSYCIG